ncbi:MAG: DUF3943 domain-containing protein [Gemmatimonadaceae bacterium]
MARRISACVRITLVHVTFALGAAIPVCAAGQVAADPRPRKSYVIPALEIVGFDVLLNVFDRLVIGAEFKSDLSSIRRNLRRSWVVENDPYAINQFGHPYQGSVYHGFARSAGLSYWAALGYTFTGSALWEIAGETTAPSRNDQIASGIAGTFLGESLFRIANLILENADGPPGPRRRTSAAVVAPWMWFNRRAFGHRFDTIYPSRAAAYFRRLQIGAAGTTQRVQGAATELRPNEALLDVSMEYGLPGPAQYDYGRPFDYFALQATVSSANGFENVLSRGLLVGDRHDIGANYRGVWGLFGSYDYIAPQIFRVSSTALSLGTTGQWWLSDDMAFQGSALAGFGYAAVGTIHGAREDDYHYGLAPQALLGARLILGDRASLDLTGREFFVADVPPVETAGHDNIARVDASFSLRFHRQQAISLKYVWSRRDALYPDLGRRTQVRGTLGVFLTFLGNDRFGAVDWR